MQDYDYQMPDVICGTEVEVSGNSKFAQQDRRFGFVFNDRAAGCCDIVYLEPDGRWAFKMDCLHVSDPQVAAHPERIDGRDFQYRGVWDYAPREKERRDLARQMALVIRENQELRAANAQLYEALADLDGRVAAIGRKAQRTVDPGENTSPTPPPARKTRPMGRPLQAAPGGE